MSDIGNFLYDILEALDRNACDEGFLYFRNPQLMLRMEEKKNSYDAIVGTHPQAPSLKQEKGSLWRATSLSKLLERDHRVSSDKRFHSQPHFRVTAVSNCPEGTPSEKGDCNFIG